MIDHLQTLADHVQQQRGHVPSACPDINSRHALGPGPSEGRRVSAAANPSKGRPKFTCLGFPPYVLGFLCLYYYYYYYFAKKTKQFSLKNHFF